MKKVMSLVLVLVLCFTLGSAALAAGGPVVMLSKQNLQVDGVEVSCEKYNIDGYNYFKLRDLAMLLNGTSSQFNVTYNFEQNAVEIVTGEAYVPNGTELVVGADKSATATVSRQTILIDGEVRDDLSVYNIGDNNFFQLRELGDALYFDVDYDSDTNSALVFSWSYGYVEGGWVEVKREVKTVMDGGETYTSVEEYTLLDSGAISEVHFRNSDGDLSSTFFGYDARGNLSSREYHWGDTWVKSSTQYNENRDPMEVIYEDSDGYYAKETYAYDNLGREITYTYSATGDDTSETRTTYNPDGTVAKRDYISNEGVSSTVYTYDAKGNLIKEVYSEESGYAFTETYTLDTDGNVLVDRYENSDGFVTTDTYSYDKNGVMLSQTYETPDGKTYTKWTFDDGYNVISEEYGMDGTWYRDEYTYDEIGMTTKDVTTYSDGTVFVREYKYTYDENGMLTSEKIYCNGVLDSAYTYEYDENYNVIRQTSEYYFADGTVSSSETLTTYQFLETDEEWFNYYKGYWDYMW